MNEQDKQKLISYIYEFACNYGRYYNVAQDADEILELVSQKIMLPEEFINELSEADKVF